MSTKIQAVRVNIEVVVTKMMTTMKNYKLANILKLLRLGWLLEGDRNEVEGRRKKLNSNYKSRRRPRTKIRAVQKLNSAIASFNRLVLRT
jgi:hypothetical protein